MSNGSDKPSRDQMINDLLSALNSDEKFDDLIRSVLKQSTFYAACGPFDSVETDSIVGLIVEYVDETIYLERVHRLIGREVEAESFARMFCVDFLEESQARLANDPTVGSYARFVSAFLYAYRRTM
ncbi:MAG: hypothetical protein KDB27_19625 [Planctomycetales bacterium]|nr:hypothetical protein [Planctomycetales bacterium]